ncbi:hypothetical protein R3P38DRAFT_1051136 [Favolaschia claudopus]|uniref:Uncharacterized protein n=1 Tax=Favolaschia claudopus TaxID=2862362 RepID=A0AAW0BFQ4_9AGAR
MLASYTPAPLNYDPHKMSKPSFKRQKTAPSEFSRSASPAASFYGRVLRPNDLPPRGTSPAASFYSQSSSSAPSLESTSSGSTKDASSPGTWSTRPILPSLMLNFSPSTPDLTSPLETPIDVPEEVIRRRQFDKATRVFGESLPLELVFQSRSQPLINSFPIPPPRRSTEGPQLPPPRETMTERRPRNLARRASLSLSTFTAKFRSTSRSTTHSRNSSGDSPSQFQSSPSSSSSDGQQQPPPGHDPAYTHTSSQRQSILSSPILFSFPKHLHSPTRRAPPTPPPLDTNLVIDIGSREPSILFPDEDDDDDRDPEATPISGVPRLARSHMYSSSEVLPRRTLPHHTRTHTDSAEPSYIDVPRPETAFADYAYARPAEYLRPSTPFDDLNAPEPPEVEVDEYIIAHPGATLAVSRKERRQGWSGEWNQRDMQDVISKLRSLK